MSEDELIRRLGIVQDRLNKVYKALNTTDIPIQEYILYLKNQLNLNIEDDQYYTIGGRK